MKYEVRFKGEERALFATAPFRQGETILENITMVADINHSSQPNASVRKGKIIAWSCIEQGEEITISTANKRKESNGV